MQWRDIVKQANEGDRVRFITSWDIYPYCVVPAGMTGTVIENDWAQDMLCVLPDDQELRAILKEWDGWIQFYQMEDDEESPFEIL
jgi:hypothetical protein